MLLEHLHRLNAAREARLATVTITPLDAGQAQLFLEGEAYDPSVASAIEAALRTGKSGIVEIGGQAAFVNVYLPPPRIVVIGAVHISQALAIMADIAGFDLSIIDPRSAFATPGVSVRRSSLQNGRRMRCSIHHSMPIRRWSRLPATPRSTISLWLRRSKPGASMSGRSEAARPMPAGSSGLTKLGVEENRIARIHAPIGLDIRASNPAEIAVAILADIIQTLRTRDVTAGRGAIE